MSLQGRRWVFTCNNYTDESEASFISFAGSDYVSYLVYGRETAPTTGTRHLQGFFRLNQPVRLSWLVNHVGPAHYERARATDEQAANYCKKDGDFFEEGTLATSQGRRTDIERYVEWIDEFIADNGRAPTESEVGRGNPAILVRLRGSWQAIAAARAPTPVLREGEPTEWQVGLNDLLEADADDRSILFVVDEQGNVGKTWFQQWYFSKNAEKTQIIGVGKKEDMAYLVDVTKQVFLIDVPRGSMQYLQYPFLENLKDRVVFSPKYSSHLKILHHVPHIVVFCNEEPNHDMLSEDRFNIIRP